MNKKNRFISKSLMISCIFLMGLTQMVSAATINRFFKGNDCSGVFGTGFDSCSIFKNEAGVDIKISPVIAKYDNNLSNPQINNTEYPSFDGSEISFNNLGTDNSSGDWLYNPASDDPGIRFVAAKAGPGFNLFWDVDDAELAMGGACEASDKYTIACLSVANILTTGSWGTPGGKELSHLTFYNSKPPVVMPPNAVPVPGAVLLFGSGLGLIGLAGKSRRKLS